ncbi:MAG: response regulator [Limnothrix sp. RL_2_0]|nr:response regulator [Limnothrix sp. RL_2_0]
MTKVLVVAEEGSGIAAIRAALVTEGFELLVVNSAQEGAIAAQAQLPDLMLYSVQKSHEAGISLLETMRGQSVTVTMPFIFLLPETTPSHAHRYCMNAGADDCLVKPYTNAEIRAAIQGRLQQHQLVKTYLFERLAQLRHNLAVALPHELRTPLQGIITSAELLNGYWETLEEADITEITENISLSAKRLNELIQKFLLYTKLDLASSEPEDFNQWYFGTTRTGERLLTSIAEKVARRHQRSNDLRLDLCTAEIAIPEKWLRILVEELLENAFKFSGDDDCHNNPEILINSRVQGDQWRIQIRDHGRGMTPEEIRDFGAYIQFNRLRYEQQGVGLGLAIAERIVKIYNGTMTIDSNINQGTMVTVSLPLGNDNEDHDDLIIG